MKKIKYVKHCSNLDSLLKILKDGYFRSQKGLNIENYELDIKRQDPTKVFLQIVFWKEQSYDRN